MRRPSPLVQRGSNDTDMNSTMTPMIDVVFLLLVFFVWTASFQIVEQILPTDLSEQLGSDVAQDVDPLPEDDFEKIVVRINWDGANPAWSINSEAVGSIDEVKSFLAGVAKVKLNATVILHPESIVPLGHVIQAYDVAKSVGFVKVSFAVNSTTP